MFSLVPFNRREANLFRWMDDLERSVLGEAVSGDSQFRCDISEKGDEYLLEAELPGFDKDDIHVDLNGDMLTISASHQSESEKRDEDGKFVRRERRFGSFSRSFDVAGIRAGDIKADYKNGVLSLTLPKQKEMEPSTRRIEIES